MFFKKREVKRKCKSLVELLNDYGIIFILIVGISIYVILIALFSFLSVHVQNEINYFTANGVNQHLYFHEFLYANFITSLTVGYGDYTPHGWFRLFAVLQALLGTALLGSIIALVSVRALLPDKNSIIFSKYGYYCLDTQCFMVIFLNQTKSYLINAETSAYYKSGNNWGVRPAVRSPFITDSVQTFHCEYSYLFEDVVKYLEDSDRLRVGITGNLGVSNYSTSKQYKPHEILVIQSRDVLTRYDGFHFPDKVFKQKELYNKFMSMFNYEPQGAKFLSEYKKTD